MKKKLFVIIAFLPQVLLAQTTDVWKLNAGNIDPYNYYGETVANGMIGIVSSSEPFKVKDIVLNGAFDLYGRGRVSNILKTFNFVNMYLEVDGARIENFKQVQNMQQSLDMRHASFTTTFNYNDKLSVSYTYYALRQLPYTALATVTITAKKMWTLPPQA